MWPISTTPLCEGLCAVFPSLLVIDTYIFNGHVVYYHALLFPFSPSLFLPALSLMKCGSTWWPWLLTTSWSTRGELRRSKREWRQQQQRWVGWMDGLLGLSWTGQVHCEVRPVRGFHWSIIVSTLGTSCKLERSNKERFPSVERFFLPNSAYCLAYFAPTIFV